MLRLLALLVALSAGLSLGAPTAEACPMADAKAAAAGELPKDAAQVRYSVEGMTCGSCALKIREVVEQLKGVKAVLVHMDGTMEVAFDDKVTNPDAIIASAQTAGEYTFKKV